MFGDIHIRPASDADGDAVGWLTARSWADYPGCYYDRHGELAELDRIASCYEEKGGQAWVAVADEGRVVGSIAAAPAAAGVWEIFKMYVDPRCRRAGLASRLLAAAEARALVAGADGMQLWTDTRFETAHRFYEGKGYVADGRTRALYDLSNSIEYFYAKRLNRAPAS